MSKHKLLKKIIIIISISIVVFIIFFCTTKSKKIKIGNNSSSQEIIENILNISSYKTTIEVEITSNKNVNKYIIKQTYIAPDFSEQEIIEPENIAGIKITKTEKELKVENTNLNISKIYTNYEYMTDNSLDLSTFIEAYIESEKQEYEEKNNEIILEVENEENPYTKYRTLYISKETGNPTKMEIKSNGKKTSIYIIYKEVEFE